MFTVSVKDKNNQPVGVARVEGYRIVLPGWEPFSFAVTNSLRRVAEGSVEPLERLTITEVTTGCRVTPNDHATEEQAVAEALAYLSNFTHDDLRQAISAFGVINAQG